MTERKSIHNFRERKDFEKLLERSSLAHHKLWAQQMRNGALATKRGQVGE